MFNGNIYIYLLPLPNNTSLKGNQGIPEPNPFWRKLRSKKPDIKQCLNVRLFGYGFIKMWPSNLIN